MKSEFRIYRLVHMADSQPWQALVLLPPNTFDPQTSYPTREAAEKGLELLVHFPTETYTILQVYSESDSPEDRP